MNRPFAEFTADDMMRIQSAIENECQNFIYSQVKNRHLVRIDTNGEWYVLEYKERLDNSPFQDHNNPTLTVNIRKDFSHVIVGFDSTHEKIVGNIITTYLKAKNFIA